MSVSKNIYTDKLNDIVPEYNNTCHRLIKMKPIDFKTSTYFDFKVENNNKHPKFEVGDHVRIVVCYEGFSPTQKSHLNFLMKKKIEDITKLK